MRMAGARTGLAIALLAAVAAGCGSSSTGPPPAKKLRFEIENFGPEVQFSIPKSVNAGVQEAVFQNQSDSAHSAQLLRYDGQRAPLAVLRAASAWGEHGKALPDWIHLAGGFGRVKAHGASEGAVKLEPGAYVVVDLESQNKPVYGQFNAVPGKADSSPLPAAAAHIKAAEYSFSATGLTHGAHRVSFENVGDQPHMLAAAPIAKGASLADVKRAVKSQKGKPPIDESKAVDLAVIDGHTSQDVQLNLARGKYALICFVPDRKGGPPHVAKGMISAADVR
jgi:hypothetical protein